MNKTEEYMSYINEHIQNVQKVWDFIPTREKLNLPTMVLSKIKILIAVHDISKNSPEEFEGYRQYFYPENGEYKNKFLFDLAWNHHQKSNKHHWEYWIMCEGVVLPMPLEYVIEMACDWGAMSLKFGGSIMDWYDSNKYSMKLHPETIEHIEKWVLVVDDALQKIRTPTA